MKWSLIYEFDVEIYRRAPTVRIFLDKILLNEFVIEQKTVGVINFEYDAKEKNVLSIQFLNDDNNYSNGFMTKFTSIIPQKFYIFPSRFLKKNIRQVSDDYEYFFSKRNYLFYRKTGTNIRGKPRIAGLDKIRYYYKERAIIPENLFFTYDMKGNLLPSPLMARERYGSSGVYDIILTKKHGMLLMKENHKGFFRVVYNDFEFFENIQKNI